MRKLKYSELLVIVVEELQSLNRRIDNLTRKVNRIMATEQDLQDSVDSLTSGVNSAVTELDALYALVIALPVGQVVTQAQVDSLNAQLNASRDALSAAVAKDAPPATPAP